MALTERDLNIPRKTPPAQKTPTTQSKLPRRIPTPNSTPGMTKWSSSVADQVTSAQKAAKQKLSNQTDASSAVRSRQTQQMTSEAVEKPWPGEKPLPPRPIARLSNSLSPSKDSRTLIDAHEEPLCIISSTGEKRDWPSLTPQSTDSQSTVETTDFAETSQPEKSSPSSPSRATRASLMAAETTLTNVITGKSATQEYHDLDDSPSSTSSYASATDGGSPQQPTDDPGLTLKKTREGNASTTQESGGSEAQSLDFPIRQASLRNRISDGSLVNPSDGPFRKVIDFTDFTRTMATSPAPSGSRKHSPSPASFSRLRPGSLSHTDSKRVKTASRIPVLDTKKVNVVDVGKNRLSASSMSNPALAPSFGSRRLASPDALKVLENGKMRRQLKRMPRDASISDARAERTWTPDSNATTFTAETPSLSYSLDSSPNGTVAPNSPEVGPLAPSPYEVDEAKPGPEILKQEQECHHAISEVTNGSNGEHKINFDDDQFDVPIHSRRPPPTSPFTMPLQTIPSQAVLPTTDILTHEETQTEVIRTLSRLEGEGSPPKSADVDHQTLLNMFGHLKRGFEKKNKNSATLSENAAAAERYLAQHPSGATEGPVSQGTERMMGNPKSNPNATADKAESPCKGKRKQTMISKWSDSTPSNKGLSPIADGLSAGQAISSIKSCWSTAESKEESNDGISIRYPSRIPAGISLASVQPADAQTADETATHTPTVARRRSSPTLGKNHAPNNKKGSVKAAREGIQVANASFSRTTLSAESKKTTRMPTPNTKIFSIPETESRGRSSPVQKRRSRQARGVVPKVSSFSAQPKIHSSNRTQTPRSRSRSRYVLDKINDIFSGKRDRKSEAVPPVPRFEKGALENSMVDTNTSVKSNGEVCVDGSPTKTPQLPKMPSLSPSTKIALRSISPTTMKTDETATVDSCSDSQSVQNLAEHVIGKAQRETNPQRKERLLNFAKVLNDSLISTREAQISAETAQHAAKSAQMSYEMTQQSLAMLQRLAVAMTRTSTYGRS